MNNPQEIVALHSSSIAGIGFVIQVRTALDGPPEERLRHELPKRWRLILRAVEGLASNIGASETTIRLEDTYFKSTAQVSTDEFGRRAFIIDIVLIETLPPVSSALELMVRDSVRSVAVQSPTRPVNETLSHDMVNFMVALSAHVIFLALMLIGVGCFAVCAGSIWL